MASSHTRPSPRSAAFWNRHARRYAKSPVADPAAYQHKLDETARLMRPDMRVLEVGCGTGTTALHHSPRAAHIDAIDFSSGMIDIAREKLAQHPSDNVSFEVATLEDWPLPHPDGAYDMVMAHSLLHLVDNLGEVLNRIESHLTEGGYFVSSTVCLREMGWLMPRVLPIGGALRLIPKVYPLSASELLDEIAGAGFQIETTWQPKPASIFVIARKP